MIWHAPCNSEGMNRITLITLIAALMGFSTLFDCRPIISITEGFGQVAEYQPRRTPRSIKFKRSGYRYASLNHTQDHQPV